MRVTVCEMNDELGAFERAWRDLCDHARSECSDLVVLPEMPFSAWFAVERRYDPDAWNAAVEAHRMWEERLSELGVPFVCAARPANRPNRRVNEGVIAAKGSVSTAHEKRYLPDENGFWEASWYDRGDGVFALGDAGEARIGFQICTELWFADAARQYGQAGADIIVSPRATPLSSRERWLVAGRASAIVAGAYNLSSNKCGASAGGFDFAGLGWIIDPDGEALAQTSPQQPFATRDIDLDRARAAKLTYPRYVR